MSSERYAAFLIFGPPGSGKGTVGSKLAATTCLKHISTGDIFRGLSPESEGGKLFHQYADSGKLVPDEVTVQVFNGALIEKVKAGKYNPSTEILLLDGIPRTASQASLIAQYIDVLHLFVLDIPNDQVIIDRLQHRAKIEGRKDDADVSVIQNRITEYRAKTAAVLECYPAERITKIPGANTPDEVFCDTLAQVIRVRKALKLL